jgi:hypothetical protein
VLVWYGTVMTMQSARLGSLTIKNLVFPEWVAALAAARLLRAVGDRIRFPLPAPDGVAAHAPPRSHLGRLMGWVEASFILFGGLVAIMGLGLPVAFAFLALKHRRRVALPRRRAGARAARAQCRAVGDQLLAHADPVSSC